MSEIKHLTAITVRENSRRTFDGVSMGLFPAVVGLVYRSTDPANRVVSAVNTGTVSVHRDMATVSIHDIKLHEIKVNLQHILIPGKPVSVRIVQLYISEKFDRKFNKLHVNYAVSFGALSRHVRRQSIGLNI